MQVAGKRLDAVICIGCLIKGETMHFEYICEAVTQVPFRGAPTCSRGSMDARRAARVVYVTVADGRAS